MEVRYIGSPLYEMTWDEVNGICQGIALEAAKTFGPDMVVGIGKGGLIPAAVIASLLKVELCPCLLTRRRRGQVIFDRPKVVLPVGGTVAGQRVLVVDEMVITGETMRTVVIMCKKEKAKTVKTACLWAGSEGWKPTWYGLETHGHIAFPWDAVVASRGQLIPNPAHRVYADSAEMTAAWKK